jgi:hypothetical protein
VDLTQRHCNPLPTAIAKEMLAPANWQMSRCVAQPAHPQSAPQTILPQTPCDPNFHDRRWKIIKALLGLFVIAIIAQCITLSITKSNIASVGFVFVYGVISRHLRYAQVGYFLPGELAQKPVINVEQERVLLALVKAIGRWVAERIRHDGPRNPK